MQHRKPKLGQHFLVDGRIARRIIHSSRIRKDDLVVEIGPGRGAMTRLLAGECSRLVAIELDSTLAASLKNQFHNNERVEIIHADILDVNIESLLQKRGYQRCFVFGNLPYYITSPILQRMFTCHDSIRAMATLVQLEVAKRITATAGGRDYGYLSVLSQLYSTPAIAMKIPPGAFSPPPQVMSALITFAMSSRFPAWSRKTQIAFLDFVKRCFASKRKNLLNNLSCIAARAPLEAIFSGLGLSSKVRAEELPVEALARVFTALTEPAAEAGSPKTSTGLS
jgi:16S rRNA (adenine1518-N6/adenine1519-N6)-dimethyltransferase